MATKDELFTDGNKFREHCNDVTAILETQWIKLVHPVFAASRQQIEPSYQSFKTISRLPLICSKSGEAQQFCHTVSVFVSSVFSFSYFNYDDKLKRNRSYMELAFKFEKFFCVEKNIVTHSR